MCLLLQPSSPYLSGSLAKEKQAVKFMVNLSRPHSPRGFRLLIPLAALSVKSRKLLNV